MTTLRDRARAAFAASRKLKGFQPGEAQLDNVERRLLQLFTTQELGRMGDGELMRQVERVWPIARYVDRET